MGGGGSFKCRLIFTLNLDFFKRQGDLRRIYDRMSNGDVQDLQKENRTYDGRNC